MSKDKGCLSVNHRFLRRSTTNRLAGAGIQGGQVYGKSDKSGSEPAENACGPADLHATIFEAFGINHKTTITDRLGRPFPISDGEPLPLT